MEQFNDIKKEIAGMSATALEMLKTTFAAFMEHDRDLISAALEKEERLNSLDRELTEKIVAFGRDAVKKEDKTQGLIYADVVGDLEMIGDYCKDILERIEIKIEERLLFSDDAVKEYVELYRITEEGLQEIVVALGKDDLNLIKEALNKQGHIDGLVDEYRRRHTQRMMDGVCSPMGCNMYLNMLDFTAAIYYHIKKISRNLLKLKDA